MWRLHCPTFDASLVSNFCQKYQFHAKVFFITLVGFPTIYYGYNTISIWKTDRKKSKMNINSTFKIYCNFWKMWMSLLASSPSDTFLATVCSAATSKDYSYILLSKRKYPINSFLHSFSEPIGVGDLNWYQYI